MSEQCEMFQNDDPEDRCRELARYVCDDCGASVCAQHAWMPAGMVLCSVCYNPDGGWQYVPGIYERDTDDEQMMRELARLRDGIGTPDELADYAATRRDILSGE